MKTINKSIVVILLFLFAKNCYSQSSELEDTLPKQRRLIFPASQDCCMLEAGRMICIKNGKSSVLENDLTLKNGFVITTKGTIKTTDDKIISLREGECVDMSGNLMPVVKMVDRKEKNFKKK